MSARDYLAGAAAILDRLAATQPAAIEQAGEAVALALLDNGPWPGEILV